MKVSVFTNSVALAGVDVYKKFIQSIQKTDTIVHNSMDADVAVIWSVLWNGRMLPNKLVWDHYRSQGKPVIVVEVGGLIRNKTWRIGVNGINNLAAFGIVEKTGISRSKLLGLKLNSWTSRGTHIKICTQHSKSETWPINYTVEQWVQETIKQIRSVSDRPIIIRPHPRHPIKTNLPVELPIYTDKDDTNFALSLTDCWAVVNFNSNPGVQSIILGTPAFVDKSSLASTVGNLDLSLIENPYRSDRTEWFEWLCHCEWLESEIEEGKPWSRVRQLLD
jgi:hypothetical protein